MQSVIERLNDRVIEWGNALRAPLFLAIRLCWGYFFVRSGVIKLGNLDSVATFFAENGIPLPWLSALITGVTHLVAGLGMVSGFMARLCCIPLGFTMVVAYMTVHRYALNPDDPADFLQAMPFLFLYATLLIIACGPGRWSVDYWLKQRKEKRAV